MILVNSGSVHQVGPNRLYVELTRALAAAGIGSLRFDLRNLGDSRIGPSEEENHPYPSTATGDLRSVLRWVGQQVDSEESLILAGLCSGAHAAFRAALTLKSDEGPDRVIAINPLTFQFKPGMSLDTPSRQQTARDARYYHDAILDLQRWKRLMSGQSDLRYITGFVVRQGLSVIWERVAHTMRRLRLSPRTRLEKELQQLADVGRDVHFVFSSTDPGPVILRQEAGPRANAMETEGTLSRRYVDGADHTFSARRHRQVVIREVLDVATPGSR